MNIQTECLYRGFKKTKPYESLAEFVAHKLVKVSVCGFKTSFQTGSSFNMVYSKETNEQFKI